MNPKRNLSGLLMLILGCIVSALGIPFLMPIGFVGIMMGAILFTSFTQENIFMDYYLPDTELWLIRKRRYFVPLLFFGIISIIYKVDYAKVKCNIADVDKITNLNIETISKADYKNMIEKARNDYAENRITNDIVKQICNPVDSGYKKAKIKYIVDIIVFCLILTMLTVPEIAAIVLTIVFGVLFAWLIILRHGEYKDAKIKQQAYDYVINQEKSQGIDNE